MMSDAMLNRNTMTTCITTTWLGLDVININLQIKNMKNMYKNIKLSIQVRSNVNTNQIKSIILLKNTRYRSRKWSLSP